MGLVRTVHIWKCDNCEKTELWNENWRGKLVMHDSWDEEVVACSAECAAVLDEKRKWKNLPDKHKGELAVEISGLN